MPGGLGLCFCGRARGVLGDAICRRPMSFVSDSRLPRGNFAIASRLSPPRPMGGPGAPLSRAPVLSKDGASRTVLSEVIGLRIRLQSRGNAGKVTDSLGGRRRAVACDPDSTGSVSTAHSERAWLTPRTLRVYGALSCRAFRSRFLLL